MQKLIEKLKENKSLVLEKQIFPDVQSYFENKFRCEHIPKDFIFFMSVYDGFRSSKLTIFSISPNHKNFNPLTFERYSNSESIKNYFSKLNINLVGNFFFVGCDDCGGRYAIRSNMQDNAIYYFSITKPHTIQKINNFKTLLEDKLLTEN